MKDYKYFSADELRCKCGKCSGGEMNEFFMKRIINLREYVNLPLILNSAYRCVNHNEHVSDTGERGPHTTGRAVDIRVHGSEAEAAIQGAFKIGILGLNHGGLGLHQRGPHQKRFIHLDDLAQIDGFKTRPWVWTY